LGGDEFVVVLPDIDNAMTAAKIAGKIQRCLADSYRVGGNELYATPSIGISIYPSDGEDTETLLRNADTAMYYAKGAGRNNHQFYAARMNEAAAERLKIENGLRQALGTTHQADSQFSLHFQPLLHVNSGRILSVEALVRWNHPTLGAIPPARFIPIAEETGLIQPLGDWVFWEACRQLKEFHRQGLIGLKVAINLSAQQLRHEGLPAVVRGALACFDLRPSDLELEITESTAMQNPEITLRVLDQLSDMGITLAIDDFGTGYSSLAYLKHLPIQRLKLDRSFVRDIENDASDAAICSATVALGHNLGLELVAEGVETVAQRDFLADLGCDVLQGFLYSRPLPAAEVVDYLRAQPTSA
jgi:predicted signal transduction protein with EAL and GGDEF domain